jgi:uncharacterized protein
MRTLRQLFARFVSRKPRIVLDTNVLVSGTIVRHGFSARILAVALDQEVTLVVSPYLLAEYLAVIQRPHIAQKYQLGSRLALIRQFIQANAMIVIPAAVPHVVLDDPQDDAILACALEGHAQYLVTGDEHLLRLAQYHGIQILTPRDFVMNVLLETRPTAR